MANNNQKNNVNIDALVDRIDQLMVILTRQSQGSQFGQIHGSQVRGGGFSSLSYSGGYYGDMTRKSLEHLTRSEQNSLLSRSGLSTKELDREKRKESELQSKINRQLEKYSKIIDRMSALEQRLAQIKDNNSQQAIDEKNRINSKLEVFGRRKETYERNINTKQTEHKAVAEEVKKILEPLVKEAQKVVKAQDAKRKFDEDREKHRIKWFKSPQAYERHEDFLYSNDKNRNDLRRISDIVQQTGIFNTSMPVVGQIGHAINRGFNAANQVLNWGDTYSQIRSMFGRGGGGAARGVGSLADGIGGIGSRAAGGGIEAVGGAAGGAGGAGAAVGEAAGAGAAGAGGATGAAGAAAALGPLAVAAGAVVIAFELFKAGLTAIAQRMIDIANGNLEYANNRFAKEEAREKMLQDLQTEQEQKKADIIVKETETENALKLKAAETASAITIESANVEAQKRVMAQELAARKLELATEATTGLLSEGINATAWNALRSKIELSAMEQMQNVDIKKLEQNLGVTSTQKSTELNIETSKQNALLEAFKTKRTGEYSNLYKEQESEWKTQELSYDLDALLNAAETQLKVANNVTATVAEGLGGSSMTGMASSVEGSQVAMNGIRNGATHTELVGPTYDQDTNTLTEVDFNNNVAARSGNLTGRLRYDDPLRSNSLLSRILGIGNSSTISSSTTEEVKKIGESGGFGAAMYDWFTGGKGTEMKKISMNLLKSQELHPVKMETTRTVGEIKRAGVELQKQYQLSQTNLETNARLGQIQAETAAQVAKTQIDAATQIEKRWIEAGKNVELEWMKMAQQMEKLTSEWEEKTNDFGVSQGFTRSAQLQTYEKAMFKAIRDDFAQYGVDMEKAIDMRSGYINATNRNIQFTGGDNRQMAALYKMMGHDSGFVAEYAGAMEIFNQGVDSSVDKLDKAMQIVNKVGLNGRKFAKEISQNLKLAQRYNFKDGTEGLMRMTQWAMKTRFNMQSLGSMIDKVLDGGLEGVIEQSSRLQVLGGNAAIYSDPFSMMYNAAVDPEAYGKQINNMVKNFGSVNRTTGETEFNMNEVLMLREIAKNTGQDVGDVMDQVRSQNRRESVKLALSEEQKARFNADQIEYMGNLAHYSKEKGGFAVNVYKGNGEFEERGINEIGTEDLKKLQPAEHEDRMEQYVLDIKSAVETITGEEIWEKAHMGAETFDALLQNANERAEIAHKKFMDNVDEYITQTKSKWGEATAAMDDMIGNLNTSSDGLESASTRIETATNNLASALEELVRSIQDRQDDLRLNVNGTININGTDVDIARTIQSNPEIARAIAEAIFRQGTINRNGGRSSHPINDGNRNTYNN